MASLICKCRSLPEDQCKHEYGQDRPGHGVTGPKHRNQGGVVVVLVLALLACLNTDSSKASIESQLAYGQFCYTQKLSGHVAANMSISVQDSVNCLDYSSSLVGDGDFEMDQIQEYSQDAEKLKRRVDAINETEDANLNLREHLKLTYSGSTPLVGEHNLASIVGGNVEENFAVNKMERDHEAFVSSTFDKSARTINASKKALKGYQSP